MHDAATRQRRRACEPYRTLDPGMHHGSCPGPAPILEAAGGMRAASRTISQPTKLKTCVSCRSLQGRFVLAFASSLDAVRFCHAAQAQVRLDEGLQGSGPKVIGVPAEGWSMCCPGRRGTPEGIRA